MSHPPRLIRGALVLALALAQVACASPSDSAAAPAAQESNPGEPGAGSAATAPLPLARARGAARNAILITIDTLRADALGFAGNTRVETPVLDRLAAGGLVFDQARAHNVFTLPSHANILTGLLPYQHGVRDNAGFVLPDDVPTVAGLLRAQGFATAAVVGAFPLDARFGLDRGFDLYDDAYPEGGYREFREAERRGGEVVEPGLAWWREHQGERRFLWLHLFDPHAPYEAEEPWRSRYRDAPYLGEVAAVDAALAPLLEPLLAAAPGDTLVVVTSDHGESLGEHGEETHGLFAYDATLRVPLVLWGPGIPGARTAIGAGHVDLVPTLLDALGVATPDGLAGESLLLVAAGGARESDDGHYFEALNGFLTRDWAPLRGVVRDAHKLVELPMPELYDLAADPDELRNLLPGDEAERRHAASLRERLPVEESWPPRPGRVSAEEARELAALGYVVPSSGRSEDATTREYTAEDDPKNLIDVNRAVHRFIELYGTGRLEEAARLAREMVERRPSMGLGYYHLAQALLEQGRTGDALATMSEARRRGIADPALLRQLALTLTGAGRSSEAIEIARPLAATGDPDSLNVYGLVLAEAGRLDQAQAVLERVFERDRRNPEAHQNLALVGLYRQRWPECESQARRALALNDELPLAWNYLAIALYNQGRRREALDAWQRSVELDPSDFDVLYNYGVVAAELGARERAHDALSRFATQAPAERYAADIARARELLSRLGGPP
ncbi:MAG TPA: sulfatase-like hydrolase/transferase [Thermoanaerobaculia bacterium]|nr:sulfatase-like hydrolase/transferase [Thermoanaerobaculia bacterium]